MLTHALGRVRHVCHPSRIGQYCNTARGVLEIVSIGPRLQVSPLLLGKVDSSARALNVAFLKAKFPL